MIYDTLILSNIIAGLIVLIWIWINGDPFA